MDFLKGKYKIVNERSRSPFPNIVLQTNDRIEAVNKLKENEADYSAYVWNKGIWHFIGGPKSLESVVFL